MKTVKNDGDHDVEITWKVAGVRHSLTLKPGETGETPDDVAVYAKSKFGEIIVLVGEG